jgi:hypothetical protein
MALPQCLPYRFQQEFRLSTYPHQIACSCASSLIGDEPLPVRLRRCEGYFLRLVPGNTPEALWSTVESFQRRLRFVLLLEAWGQERLATDILTVFLPLVSTRDEVEL